MVAEVTLERQNAEALDHFEQLVVTQPPVQQCYRVTPGPELADIPLDQLVQIDPRGVTTVISQAKGFRGYKVNKGIESPERYVLQIFWDTLENHTVDFRGGPLFPQWRAIVGPYFAQPPVVEHFTLLGKSS